MRVLVVDDDVKTVAFVRRGLSELGYVVDSCDSPEDAVRFALDFGYDVILLDMKLPTTSGIALVSEMRARGVRSSVLALTALGTTEERVAGLDAGCDDYLVKPFAFSELAARIRALGRRNSERYQSALSYGGVTMDAAKRIVTFEGRLINLSNKEFALLAVLLRDPERVFTKLELQERVWGTDSDTASNLVEVYIKFLRRKLGNDDGHQLLRTVRGVGYTLRCRDDGDGSNLSPNP